MGCWASPFKGLAVSEETKQFAQKHLKEQEEESYPSPPTHLEQNTVYESLKPF